MSQYNIIDEEINDSNLYIVDESIFTWSEVVEKELNNSITDKCFSGCISKKCSEKITEPDKIVNLTNFSEIQDISLLEYQNCIASHVRKLLKQDIDISEFNNNFDNFLNELNWLLNSSKYLSDKHGLVTFQHKKINTVDNVIPRSSYKFCNYNSDCEFNYNTRKFNGCYAQHYVHNMVYADLTAIKEYLDTGNLDKKHLDEIRKSINTISFVINHMYDELKNVKSSNLYKVNKIIQNRQ